MALLATRRYLTKSEIFRTVDGYSGSDESKERMFERDKDDLRKIGIVIEVRSLDPLFDDEPGYRIHPDSYSLHLGDLTGNEIAILSLATRAWRGAALGQSAQSALVKLRSLGIEPDFDSLPALAPKLSVDSSNFVPLAQAIMDKSFVSFAYMSPDLVAEERKVEPYGLGSRKGIWYLVGRDLDRSAMRTFRLERISGEVTVSKRREAFEIDEAFNILGFLDTNLFQENRFAYLRIRLGKGHSLRGSAEVLSSDEEFDYCKIPFQNDGRLIDQILWHGNDVVVESPDDIRDRVVEKLSALVALHV
jgi:proteasome accessory factor B